MTIKEVMNNTLLEFQMVGGKGVRTIIKTTHKKQTTAAKKSKAKSKKSSS